MAAKYKFKIEQGATLRFTLRIKSGLDLSNIKARMQIRQSHTSQDIIHEMTTENGGLTFIDSNTLSVYISAEDTAMFNFTKAPAVYDLEIVLKNGDVIRLLEGQITLSPEVTR